MATILHVDHRFRVVLSDDGSTVHCEVHQGVDALGFTIWSRAAGEGVHDDDGESQHAIVGLRRCIIALAKRPGSVR